MPHKKPKPKPMMAMDDATQEAALRQLLASAGWQLISEAIDANLALLGKAIISKEMDGAAIDEATADRLRDKHGYLEELKAMPEKLLGHLKATGSEEDFDPYHKKARELRR